MKSSPNMVLIISPNSADSDVIRTTVSQLLDQGILFKGYFEQDILHELPDDMEAYPAVIIGNRFLQQATAAEKARLEKYAAEKFVFVIDDCRWPGCRHPVYVDEPYAELDGQVSLNAFAAAAGLGNQELPPLPQKVIIQGIQGKIFDLFENFKKISHIGEYHHHILHAALAIEASPYATPVLTENIDDFLKNIFNRPLDVSNGDAPMALGFAPLYAKRMHVDAYREKFAELLTKFVDNRCRTPEGHLAIAGYVNDPLLLHGLPEASGIHYAFTNVLRSVTMNDIFVSLEILAAGSSYTGDPRFFDEFWKMFTYVKKVQQDRDGLFFYASRDGKPISEKWARGQGHALCGMFHALTNYPEMPEQYRTAIIQCLDEIGHGLAAVQRADGRWSNVLDHEYVRTETSSTVLFTYVFASACNRGWLDAGFYKPMIAKARAALLTRFWRGLGSGNCRGTYPAFHNPNYYDFRDQHMCIMPYAAPALIESAKLLKVEEYAYGHL